MTSVLVVDDDDDLRRALQRQLEDNGFEVGAVSTGEEALETLEAKTFDVLLTDLRMSGTDGIDLIASAIRVAPQTRAVLMSAYATARDHQLATRLGAVSVLTKPFTPHELRRAVQHAIESREGFRGSIHGLSLIDMLQMFHLGRRSVTITLGGLGDEEIHVENGEIIHAVNGDTVGEPALATILQSESGSVETCPLKQVERTITRPFSGLILDLIRQSDEAEMGFGGGSDSGESSGLSGEWSFDLEDDETHDEKVVTMGKMDDSCKKVVDQVDGGVACGVVDLDTGMVLGVHNNAGYSQTLNEIVGAAAMDMFRGPNVSRVEQLVRAHRGVPESGEHYFEEIHVSSRHNFHFMKTIKGGKAVIVLVTRKTTSIGMGWASMKAAVPEIEPQVP